MQATTTEGGNRAALLGIGLFLGFACTMAGLAGTMLLWPGTILDRLWTLNLSAHAALARFGTVAGVFFLTFGVLLLTTVVGWFQQRLWAWRVALVILCTQGVGDFVNLLRGDFLGGSVGILIAGTLIFLLLRSSVRTMFHQGAHTR